ncbi:MAG: tetratricopeptide repeat protein [Actinobacteria bacterium]|nr:tetratricopeptide repeat protein [Actinomycetota bacterium]
MTIPELPSGTVTLVFTDIEGSTRLLEALGERYGEVLAEHRKLLREAFSASGGVEVDTQGDALFHAFSRSKGAVLAAAEAQRALASHPWAQGVSVAVRMGIHTGEPALGDEGYVGADVHRAARICSAAHGGQVVVSEATARLVGDGVVELRDLGTHGLKDLSSPQHLYQLVIEGLRQDFPAIRTLEGRPNNLPRQLTPLLGREQEIEQGCRLLEGDAALVSLTGPGGTGKTRLALAMGAELLDAFTDGAFFVDLSAVTEPSLVIPAVAQALSLRESGGKTISETLTGYLAGKEMVVILDNFEQVIEAASEVSPLLASAPGLKLVVTTREPLRVRGERELAVPPLALPSRDDESDVEVVGASAAVALFMERARAVKATFELTSDNASSVAEICQRLDGLPLAIELAAARIKVMPPSSLLDRLDQSLKVLTGGARDASSRQRTLRGAIEWSYWLLSQDEQRLFRGLGVFVGGWGLEAAEAVCDRGDLELDVLDGLGSLVDKSLVRAVAGEDERFSMLETIREYAAERLEGSGEDGEIRRAHAEYFRGMAEEAEPHLVGEDQKEWFDRLDREHDNLRASLGWSLTADQRVAVATAASLSRFWYVRGHLSEGRRWLEQALEVSSNKATDAGVRITSRLAAIGYSQGDLDSARSFAERGIALAQALHDERGVMRCTETLALCDMEQGRLAEARNHLEDNLRRSRRLHDERGVAVTTGNLGHLSLLRGNYESAAAFSIESLKLHRKIRDKEGMATSLNNLGLNALATGEPKRAEPYLREALELASDVGHQDLIGSIVAALAAVAALSGELERGAALLGAAKRIRDHSGVGLEPIEWRTHDRTKNCLLDALGEGRCRQLFAQGEAMAADEALRHVYEDDS